MATFPDQVEQAEQEAPAPEADTTEVPTTTIDAPTEVVEAFIAEVQEKLDELNKQIHKAKLGEIYYKRHLNLGKPNEKTRLAQLAGVQKRMHDLAVVNAKRNILKRFLKRPLLAPVFRRKVLSAFAKERQPFA